MAELSAWEVSETGDEFARVQPSSFVVPDGAYALVLGSDTPGYFNSIVPGDYFEWSQTASREGNNKVSFPVFLRGPDRMPSVSDKVLSRNFLSFQSLSIRVDGGLAQNIVFSPSDVTIGDAKDYEIAAAITNQLDGGFATATGEGVVELWSDSKGPNSSCVAVGGSAPINFFEYKWFAELLIDDVIRVEREIEPGDDRQVQFTAAMAGSSTKLAFRLSLRSV